ncbi:MAG: EpsD family peptidyl-prolyl cis-trans isomerase [Piscinibacter sp.]
MFRFPKARRALATPVAMAAVLLLAACGGGGGAERKSASQVAATVNDAELTVHQVQAVLERQPRLAAGDGGGAARVLEGLIDQELAAQAARTASLDKDPRVVQRIEAARREILAQSWQESVAAKARGVSSDEIDRYYDDHPELFAQRRIYVLQETAVEGDAAAMSALAAKAGETKSAQELSVLLHRSGLAGQTRTLAQAAEDLPLGLLGRLAPLEVGRSVALTQGGSARVYTVLQAIQAPVSRRQAQGAITAYIGNQRKSQAVGDSIKKLRADARIAYPGNLAASAPAAGASAAR